MDKFWGTDDTYGLTDESISGLRNSYFHGSSVPELSVEYGITVWQVERVLDGHVGPYRGGPLRPLPLQGCNPKRQESTKNRQRFVRGVILRAYRTLTLEQFEVFAHFNGMRLTDALAYVRNLEDLNERLAQERFRGVLVRHAQGASVEESVVAYSKRA